ncbi:MAG: hypothetical protein V1806_15090 [Pseudomonadota bacterium]
MLAEIKHEDIEQRLVDWQQRLNELYSSVQSWLPSNMGYQIDTSGSVVMNEELMKRRNISAVNLPTMTITHNSERVLYFEPKGLWVIGANGRVDVFGKESTWVLVDISDRFASETKWKVTEPSDRRTMKDFDKSSFLEMLSEQ